MNEEKLNKELIEKFENRQIKAFQDFADDFIEWYGKNIKEVSQLNDWRFKFIIKFYAYSDMSYLLAKNIITFFEEIFKRNKTYEKRKEN